MTLPAVHDQGTALADVQITLVTSIDDVIKLKEWMSYRHPFLAVDTETEGLKWWRDRPRLLQVGDERTAWVIPWNLWGGAILEVVRDFEGDLVMHNAKFDVHMFEHWSGVRLPRHRIHDTRVQAHILDPSRSTGLKYLAAQLVDKKAATSERILHEGMAANRWDWATVPVDYEPYWVYAGVDVVLTSRLHRMLCPKVMEEAPEAYALEMATTWVLMDMERKGVAVDVPYAQEKLDVFQRYVNDCERWCLDNYGVKPGSNAKVIERLRELTGYEFTVRTRGGALALDKEVLEDVTDATGHPLAQTVLMRRKMQKLASTYLQNFIDLSVNGRIHPSFNGAPQQREESKRQGYGARTGRMSVSDPSLQNLPRRNNAYPAAVAVRNCITASTADHWLLMCDFDQVEFRLLAHLARDPALIAAFGEGDFFVNIARQLFDDPTIEKDDPRRQPTKNAGYAKIYGAGIPKFAKTAGIPTHVAQQIMQRLDQLYPGMRQLSAQVDGVARQRFETEGRAYVRSPLTRRPYPCDGLDKTYALVNYLIQGTAAEVLKMKDLELVKAGVGDMLVLNVHDEVILDVRNDDLPEVSRLVGDVMNDHRMFTVPLTASIDTTWRWGEKGG